MSDGKWCCSSDDGNSWFGDTYFNTAKWKRGLEYMVKHVSSPGLLSKAIQPSNISSKGKSWPALTSIGMRNELRNPTNNATLAATYNWGVWYTNMVAASKVINAANPDILVTFSGLNFDTQLKPVVEGTDLGNGVKFRKSDFAFQDKIILELHDYENSITSCTSLQNNLISNGFSTLTGTKANTLPMMLTEWGHNQADNSYTGVYASCLRSFLPAQKVGWFYWVVAGSYYIRSGTQDYEETWGLYNHDWSGWRSAANIVEMKKAVQATLA